MMNCKNCENGVCTEGNCGHGTCGACNRRRCWPAKLAWFLVFIGGVNWGLVGLGYFLGKNLNAVNWIFSGNGMISKWEAIVYILVGLAAIMKLIGCRCRKCMGMSEDKGM